METPIYTFLQEYAEKNPLRMHMPGHKGRAPVPELEGAYTYDLTEISGADSLFEAEGIIAESERNASRLFGTVQTVYSCGGSTLCIQAMLHLMKQEGRRVVAARTVHRAFLNACVLLGLEVSWVYPSEEKGILSGAYTPEDFERVLETLEGQPAGVYVTSPDYLGHMADIRGIAEVSHRYDAPLLVDNAHGAHLAFLEKSLHPMALGADLCCDSAHKMLPCLTGCAYLHTAREEYAGRLKDAMGVFGSTSPSYLMLLSLDLCNRFLAEEARERLRYAVDAAKRLRQVFSGKLIFGAEGGDPLHLSIDTAAMGCDGRQIAMQLEKLGCYAEYAGRESVVLLLSAMETEESMRRLEECLTACDFTPDGTETGEPPAFPRPEAVMGLREAALSESEIRPAAKALGQICAGVKVPCPPAVPVVISGERIDESVLSVMEYYGINTAQVVKESVPKRPLFCKK